MWWESVVMREMIYEGMTGVELISGWESVM